MSKQALKIASEAEKHEGTILKVHFFLLLIYLFVLFPIGVLVQVLCVNCYRDLFFFFMLSAFWFPIGSGFASLVPSDHISLDKCMCLKKYLEISPYSSVEIMF